MIKFIKALTLAALVATLSYACSEEPEESTGTITGVVTEASGGTEPLSGVTVSIVSTGQSTTTGNDGTYIFNAIQPGSYSLRFSKSGYTTDSRSVSVVAGGETKADIQMKREVQTAEITITPSSLNFGTTQSDMSITIKNNGKATAEWALNLGNNHWLSASQLGGSIQAGQTQSITFSVDRDLLSEPKSVIVNLQAFGNSFPISISCAPRNAKSEMTVEPTTLDFGTTLSETTFTIRNTGIADLRWSANGLSAEALSLSATSGTIAGGGNSVIIAKLDRSLIEGEFHTTFLISDGIKEQAISVNANITSGGTGTTDPTDIVVPQGLYAYFRFNGDFNDSSENGHYCYASPEPAFVDGVTAGTQGIAFARTKETAVFINDGLIDSRSMTVSFWAKDISEGNIFHVESSNGNTQNKMMTLTFRDGHLKFVMSRNNNYYNFDKTGNFTHKSITDGQWHHIVLISDFNKISYSNVTTSLYVDGKLMDTITEDGNSISENHPSEAHYGTGTKFVLGGENVPNMKIANLRVYDARQLSADEIIEIHKANQ